MARVSLRSITHSSRRASLAFLVVLLSFCVVAHMLGTPVTLTSLLSTDGAMESVSEDLSIAQAMPETRLTSNLVLYEKLDPSLYHPIFGTSVFHPPHA